MKLSTSSNSTSHRCAGRREHPAERLRARRGRRGVRAEQLGAPVAGELTRDVDPRRLPPRIPGVADEHRHPRRRRGRQPASCSSRSPTSSIFPMDSSAVTEWYS